MEREDEKKQLLSSGEKYSHSDSYGSRSSSSSSKDEMLDEPCSDDDAPSSKSPWFSKYKCLQWLYDHREKIPGYGMFQLVKQSGLYSLYVLLALLVAYLLNQLDRYTLPIVTQAVGADLRYGEHDCQDDPGRNKTVYDDLGFKFNCSTFDNESACVNSSEFWGDDGTTYYACRWWFDGRGILYQVVAGPVFNNAYVLAGVFTGFLADYGNRKVFLVISLAFWSSITLVTGFAKQYWHLVILRALLAIGAAGCSPFAVSILSDYFKQELRGTALGVYYWGIYFGYSLAFAIGNGIEQSLNWHWVFFLSGIFGLVAAPIILVSVKEPQRQRNPDADRSVKSKAKKVTTLERIVLLLKVFIFPGVAMLFFCIAAGIRNAGGYVWAYNTELFFHNVHKLSPGKISQFMSVIPLVGGSIGAVVGGLISDILVKKRGPYARIWVLIISQMLAAPFAAGALLLPYPWCFLSLIPSNVIGEMWVGVASAIVVDLVPSSIRTSAIAVYLFIITVIGGNFNLVVPPLRHAFERVTDDGPAYRLALILTFPGLYVLSSLLFILVFFLMRWDLRRKARIDAYMLVNEQETLERSEDREEDRKEDFEDRKEDSEDRKEDFER